MTHLVESASKNKFITSDEMPNSTNAAAELYAAYKYYVVSFRSTSRQGLETSKALRSDILESK